MAETFPGPSPKQKDRDVSKVKKWASAKKDASFAEKSMTSDSPGDPSASDGASSSSASSAKGK